ncbi:MAG: carboxypeptidase-like regulatory domain-containing protein [Chloroflexota bacterium]
MKEYTLKRWIERILAITLLTLSLFLFGSTETFATGIFTPDTSQSVNVATISGQVVDEETRQGIPGVQVSMVRQDMEGRVVVVTDTSGGYSANAVPPGVYQITFLPPLPYFAENYDDFAVGWGIPNFVTATEGATIRTVNADLRKGLTVSGRVVDEDGNGLPNIGISAKGRGSLNPFVGTNTAADGTFSLGPLWPDAYLLFFRSTGRQASQWYDGASRAIDATWLDVSADVADLAIELRAGARISGRITDPDGQPVQFASVSAYPAGSGGAMAFGFTDADGNYTMNPGLPTGWYQVQAVANQAFTWNGGTSNQDSSVPISVTQGISIPNVDIQIQPLTQTGSIRGTVTNAVTGFGVSTSVTAYGTGRRSFGSQFANNGEFELTGLPPGEYWVEFNAGSEYYIIYYDEQVALGAATPVTVEAGETTVISQSLQLPGTISGIVTAEMTGSMTESMPVVVPGTQVQVWPVGTETFTPTVPSASMVTGLNGQYTVDGLIPGDYRLYFSPPSPYLGEWYSNSHQYASAQVVTVLPNETTPNVDASVRTGVVITGTARAEGTGEPLVGATVIAKFVDPQAISAASSPVQYDYLCEDLIDSLLPAPLEILFGNVTMWGTFKMLLPPEAFAKFCLDTVRVHPKYFSKFLGNVDTEDLAQAVEILAPSPPTLEFENPLGSQIKLTLITPTERPDGVRIFVPVRNGIVRYADARTGMERTALADENGNVKISALPRGTYRLVVGPPGQEIYDLEFSVNGRDDVCETRIVRAHEAPLITYIPYASGANGQLVR